MSLPMTSNPSNRERLLAISQRRSELDLQIKEKERRMRRAFDELFTPAQRPSGRMGSLVANAGTVAAIADGALLGYRLFRQFRKFTRK